MQEALLEQPVIRWVSAAVLYELKCQFHVAIPPGQTALRYVDSLFSNRYIVLNIAVVLDCWPFSTTKSPLSTRATRSSDCRKHTFDAQSSSVAQSVRMGESPRWVHHRHVTYSRDDKQILGNLVFVQCFGTPILFLNSYEDANELLDKRSAKYSSRPSLVMANELCVHMIHSLRDAYSPLKN